MSPAKYAPEVDLAEFKELLGKRLVPTRLRVSIVQQPQGSTTDGEPLHVKFHFTKDHVPATVESVQFEASAAVHSALYSARHGAETFFFLARPFHLLDDTLQPLPERTSDELRYLEVEEQRQTLSSSAEGKSDEAKGSVQVLDNGTDLELTFCLQECYTAALRSPVYVALIVLVASDRKASRGCVCKPISVYEKYEEQTDSPILSAAYNGSTKKLKELLASGEAVDVEDGAGATALHVACLYGHDSCVRELLRNKARVNKPDRDGRTPLHKAAYGGQVACMKLILKKKKIKPNSRDIGGATALHIAAYKNQLECGQLLLDAGADVNAVDEAGATPLHQACFQGHAAFCASLLDNGAKIEIRDKSGVSPLEICCFNGRAQCADLLFQRGATTADQTLLHHTAFYGYIDCLNLLLDCTSIDPNCVDEEASSPLHKAAFQGHVECVTRLLTAGCDVSGQDEEGATPLHQACYNGHTACMQALIEAGASVESEDNEGGKPLHNACFNGHQDAVSLLLANGANPGSTDASSSTPLHFAAENGHTDCMRILVEYKVPIDARDEDGMTPLHQGVNYADTIQLLLSRDADVNAMDQFGTTALMLAVENGREDILRLLMSSGADATLRNEEGLTVMELAEDAYLKKVLEEEGAETDAEKAKRKKVYEEAAVLFNQKPKKGIALLIERVMERAAEDQKAAEERGAEEERVDPLDEVVHFLHRHNAQLNKTKLGEVLGEHDEQSTEILSRFINYLDFAKMDFDQALRTFLSKFRLPGEAQKIDRIMESFARRYHENNPGIFQNEDMAYMLAFSLIMLNTDLHNPSIKNKMTCEQFIKNNSNTGLGDDLPEDFLRAVYKRMEENEIKMDAGDMNVFGNSVAVKMGWLTKQGGRIKTWKKRWFILSDGVLYYFKEKQEETSQAIGIVPMEDLVVRNAESKKKYCFELLHSDSSKGESMKALKRAAKQGLQKGHHDSYFLCASNAQEMEEWMDAISKSVFSNPLQALIEKRRALRENTDAAEATGQSGSAFTSGIKLDFRDIREMLTMCQICLMDAEIITKSFPDSVVDSGYKNSRFVLVSSPVSRSHTVVVTCTRYTSAEELSTDLQKRSDLLDHYGLSSVAQHMRKGLMKHLKKDFSITLCGHGLGGSVATLVALSLQKKGYHISKVTTFGSPFALSDKLRTLAEENNLPVTAMALHGDVVTSLFADCPPFGSRVTLLRGVHYCYEGHVEQDEDQDTQAISTVSDTLFSVNSLPSYLENVRGKMELAVKVPFHLRTHYQ